MENYDIGVARMAEKFVNIVNEQTEINDNNNQRMMNAVTLEKNNFIKENIRKIVNIYLDGIQIDNLVKDINLLLNTSYNVDSFKPYFKSEELVNFIFNSFKDYERPKDSDIMREMIDNFTKALDENYTKPKMSIFTKVWLKIKSIFKK